MQLVNYATTHGGKHISCALMCNVVCSHAADRLSVSRTKQTFAEYWWFVTGNWCASSEMLFYLAFILCYFHPVANNDVQCTSLYACKRRYTLLSESFLLAQHNALWSSSSQPASWSVMFRSPSRKMKCLPGHGWNATDIDAYHVY